METGFKEDDNRGCTSKAVHFESDREEGKAKGRSEMTKNASKNLARISNCCLILSLCTLTIISFIDVVPERQSTLECVFYVGAIVFVISLSISLCWVIVRFSRKRAKWSISGSGTCSCCD